MEVRNARHWARGRDWKFRTVTATCLTVSSIHLPQYFAARTDCRYALIAVSAVLIALIAGYAFSFTALLIAVLPPSSPTDIKTGDDSTIFFSVLIILIAVIELLKRQEYRAVLIARVAESRREVLLTELGNNAVGNRVKKNSFLHRLDDMKSSETLRTQTNSDGIGLANGNIGTVADTPGKKMHSIRPLAGSEVFVPIEKRTVRAVLLVHGLSSSPSEMSYLARALEKEGYEVSRAVIPGYSAAQGEEAMEVWIEAALEKFDALAARSDYVAVCGLSIGALLALVIASRRPSLDALILLSLTLHYDGWAVPWYAGVLQIAYHSPLRHRYRYRESHPFGLKHKGRRDRVARSLQRKRTSSVGPATLTLSALYQARRLGKLVIASLPKIQADTLIIHAIDDETSSPGNVNVVLRGMRSQNIRTIWLGDSYHMITQDNERDVVCHEVVRFLKRQ